MGRQRQHGAVSLFAVMFASLLLTILVVGFTKLMITDSQQAIHGDLSRSAYDSALAGVEDAKRVIRACQKGEAAACAALAAGHDCRVVARAGVAGDPTADETRVRTTATVGTVFDQAYTCVNIAMDTSDFLDKIPDGGARLIPLRTRTAWQRIVIEWYTSDDAQGAGQATQPAEVGDTLPPRSQWGRHTPPLLRTQLIVPPSPLTVVRLDDSAASQTVFLRPAIVSHGQPSPQHVALAGRPRATSDGQFDNSPHPVSCWRQFGYDGYACRVELTADVVSPERSQLAFLRLAALYNAASVRVSLLAADGSPVLLYGVQPAVDATGRASDLFRRVEARLRVGEDFPYPDAVVEVAHHLCKDFFITDPGSAQPGLCRP